MSSIGKRASMALARIHKDHGEYFDLYKYRKTATSSIYRQRSKTYESPVQIKGQIARLPVEEILGKTGDASTIDVQITVPVSFLKEQFPNIPPSEAITTSDQIAFDERKWRITQVAFTARLDSEPLLVYIKVREILGQKEERVL